MNSRASRPSRSLELNGRTLHEFYEINNATLVEDAKSVQRGIEEAMESVVEVLQFNAELNLTSAIEELLPKVSDCDLVLHQLKINENETMTYLQQLINGNIPIQSEEDVNRSYTNHIQREYECSSLPKSKKWENECKQKVYEITKDPKYAPVLGEEDELMITEQVETFVDPITNRIISNPLVSKRCGHIYEATAIKQHISATRHHRVECPTVGCGHVLTLSDLTKDPSLERRLRHHKKRLEQQERQNEEEYEDL